MDYETNTTVIIDNNYYSIGFPNEKWDEIITRDNYISQIENNLDNDTNVIFIEGAEDSGKTTLNGIFARKNAAQTVSVFFNPSNSLDFKREYLFANIVPQIKNLLNEEIHDSEHYDNEEYRHSIFQLREKLKSNCKCVYFIIDGLESKINEDPEFVRDLFDFIPIGENIFKFLISGNAENFKNTCQKLKKQVTKSILLSGLSTPEINKFLKINDISANKYKELLKVTGGLPGRLKTLRRLLENENYSLDKINNSTTYKNWIELDCESVNNSKPIINGILSLVSLNIRLFSSEEIANILSIPIDEVTIHIKNIRVLELNDDFVNFVSPEHKKYFANYLRGNNIILPISLTKRLFTKSNI